MPTTNSPFQAIYQETMAALEAYVRDYNAQAMGIPDRIRARAEAILTAPDLPTASRLAQRAKEAGLVAFLAAWANNKIPGRITALNVEQRIKKIESLANHLENLGDHEGAQRQRERADRVRRFELGVSPAAEL